MIVVRLMAAAIIGGTVWGMQPALAEQARDPFDSPVWEDLRDRFMGGDPVVFDDRVRVHAPPSAEDSRKVPVAVDARELDGVEKILVLVDLNPFPRAAEYHPLHAVPYLELRVKLEQASVIRAAVRTADGSWHVGGAYVDATGGGCAAPRPVAKDADWADHLGHMAGRVWRRADGVDRIRLRVMHPMDTGLVDNIPAFFLQTVTVSDGADRLLARLDTYEPVAENPVFSLEIDADAANRAYALRARDNDGNEMTARLPAGMDY